MIATGETSPGVLPEAIRTMLVHRLAGGTLELPVLPDVAMRVVKLCNDEGADPRQLAVELRRDPAMAAHLMRIANSPLYAQGATLVSLDQAVSRLGMAKVREIALIIACKSKVFAVPGHEAALTKIFRHCLAAGLFAQEIARSRRWNVEEAFLAGLLHDIGRPVLIQTIHDLCAHEGVCPAPAAIMAACDVLHARVGSELVKSWTLPVRISEAVMFHHEPEKSGAAKNLSLTTALADDLAHLVVGPKVTTAEAVRAHPLCPALNLYPEEMEALVARAPVVLSQVEAMA